MEDLGGAWRAFSDWEVCVCVCDVSEGGNVYAQEYEYVMNVVVKYTLVVMMVDMWQIKRRG